jgi:hypothetical protein
MTVISPAIQGVLPARQARGGDRIRFGAPFTTLGVTYQQALFNYIVDALNGLIAADFPGRRGPHHTGAVVRFDNRRHPRGHDRRNVTDEVEGCPPAFRFTVCEQNQRIFAMRKLYVTPIVVSLLLAALLPSARTPHWPATATLTVRFCHV